MVEAGALRERAGVGLRSPHYSYIFEHKPAIPFFEAISENFLGLRNTGGGRPLRNVERIRADYPLVLHGVSLSIGSTDLLDRTYLRRLRDLYTHLQPAWVSDHLCWTGVAGTNLHDLLPLPYTQEAIEHVCDRVDEVQDFLGRRFTLENVSSYVDFKHSEMTEWEFLAEITRRTGCGVLFDVNNIYVSSRNHGFDPLAYLRGFPGEAIVQYHLAGGSDHGDYIIDTHDRAVPAAVWELYRATLDAFGPRPTLIEWDDKLPEFPELAAEAAKAEGEIARWRERMRSPAERHANGGADGTL